MDHNRTMFDCGAFHDHWPPHSTWVALCGLWRRRRRAGQITFYVDCRRGEGVRSFVLGHVEVKRNDTWKEKLKYKVWRSCRPCRVWWTLRRNYWADPCVWIVLSSAIQKYKQYPWVAHNRKLFDEKFLKGHEDLQWNTIQFWDSLPILRSFCPGHDSCSQQILYKTVMKKSYLATTPTANVALTMKHVFDSSLHQRRHTKSEQDFQHQYICLSDRCSIASCTFDSFTIWTIIGEVMQDLIRALHTIKYFFRVNFIVANKWFEFFNILTHLFFHFTPGIEHTDICNVTECVCVRACGRDGGNLLNCETPWSVPVSRSLAHLVSFFVIVFASAAVKHQRRPLARP